MLTLEGRLRRTKDTCYQANLTDQFSEKDLSAIGSYCWDRYNRDEQSREPWLRRSRAAMDLAMQVQQAKTFPWPNCANIAFPLVTIAALQFHARAYPAMFAGPDIVKYRVPGLDPTGELTQVAQAVAKYMSYQVLDLDESFEEQHDRLLINVPIVGCAFVKTRRDVRRQTNTSTVILAQDLVVDYFAKSVDGALTKTQIVPLYRNEVYERCIGGTFRNILEESWYQTPFQTPELAKQAEKDRAEGRGKPSQVDESTPIVFGEQHTWLDLDCDGYAEPYIITFDLVNKSVVRIVARWESPDDVEEIDGKVLRINATEHYTKYGLIPAPDGSIYDVGFGVLLGPLNESVNTIVNQLVDAGTMSVAAGGFLSRGVKVRGGAITFSPFGWQRVDSTGDDLRKGIFPLPVREPSQVLFALLQLLINYTQRISGSGDTMVGENPGQNTPANNMNIMVEQGMQVYSAIFKRMWRSMRDEFRKGFILNARHMPDEVTFGSGKVSRSMFLGDPSLLVPAADPNLVSESQKLQQIAAVKQSAASTPGYDLPTVERRFLQTLRVDGIDQIYPGPDKVPPLKNPKVQVEEIKTQREQMKLQHDQQQFILELMETHALNQAKIDQLKAQSAAIVAEIGASQAAQSVAQFESLVNAIKAHNDSISQRISAMAAASKAANDEQGNQQGGVQGMAPQPGNSGAKGAVG